jgi:hypothetical protein
MTSYRQGDPHNGSCQSIGPTSGPNQVGSYRIEVGHGTVFSVLCATNGYVPDGHKMSPRDLPSSRLASYR